MSYEIRYYRCCNTKCNRTPHIRFTEEMKNKILEIECEFCLQKFEVDESNTATVNPDTLPTYREK